MTPSSAYFPNMRPARAVTQDLVCTVAIDAEEDFDWDRPVIGTPHSTSCMRHIPELQAILQAYRIRPTYLLTFPILENEEVLRILRRYDERGECDLGIQLHPWVTPPFGSETSSSAHSYSGNLAPALEAMKLVTLSRRFADAFGRPPRIYRAGRYGMGEHTAAALAEIGITIDTSLAPRTDFSPEGGPDYTGFDYRPFWFGNGTRILELPLCRDIVGWGGSLAPPLYRALTSGSLLRTRLSSVMTRSRFAERITLSPEGNDLPAMIRLVRGLVANGRHVLVLSFHSSSLEPGRNPYVREKRDLHEFYDRLSGILDFVSRLTPMRFASLTEIATLMEPP